MTWEIHRLHGNLGGWREEWDLLNHHLYKSNPYYDSRFIEPLLYHFGSGQEHLCIHRRSGKIDGMLILVPRRLGTWSSFLPSQAQISAALLNTPDDITSLLKHLGQTAWRLEILNQDPAFSSLFKITADPRATWNYHVTTINVEIQGEFHEYWKTRSRNLQKNLRRYLNKANGKFRTVSLIQHHTPPAIAPASGRYGDIESKGWKAKNGTAIHKDNQQGKFYTDMLLNFASKENARIYELHFDGEIVASRLCIESKESLIILKTTYDEDMSEFAPGRLLLYMLLEEEFKKKGVKHVEFYTAATQDQIQWSTGQREIKHLTVYRTHWIKSLTETLKSIKADIAHAIKRS